MEEWKTRISGDEGQMGLEERRKTVVAGLSVLGEEGSQVVVFWGGDWLGFCVEVDQDLVEPC